MVFTQFDSVEGSPIAVNTAVTALVKGASTALPHSWRTPNKSVGFDRVRGSPASDGAVVGAATFMCDIKNTGTFAQQYGLGAIGGQLATTSSIVVPVVEYSVNVPIPAGTDLDVDVYMNGTDTSTTASVTVELRFTDTLTDTKATIAYTRMGQATAINAGVAMQTSLNSTSAGDVSVPKGYVRLIQTGVGGAPTSSVVGATGAQVQLAIPGAPIPQYFIAPSAGGTLATSNIQNCPVDVKDCSYPLAENQALPAVAFMLYTDIGAYSMFITFILSQNA